MCGGRGQARAWVDPDDQLVGLSRPRTRPQRPFRGIVLGDSVMQGALVGDDETPPACLERELAKKTGMRVSVLNAAVLGYSPEQYYHTLKSFFGRMSPHFVIVSLCGNDFGGSYNPANYVESCYWLEQIIQYCQSREVPFLIVPWPGEEALLGQRDESRYPGQVSHLLKLAGTRYFYPIEAFANEDLWLRIELQKNGEPENMSPLYNRRRWGDNHFSPLGCALWGKVVADRLLPVLTWKRLLPADPHTPTPSSPASRSRSQIGPDRGLDEEMIQPCPDRQRTLRYSSERMRRCRCAFRASRSKSIGCRRPDSGHRLRGTVRCAARSASGTRRPSTCWNTLRAIVHRSRSPTVRPVTSDGTATRRPVRSNGRGCG